jgi:hypothetical protein
MSSFFTAGNLSAALQSAGGSSISPRVIKAGIILLDPVTTQVARIVVLQYNPDRLTRTLQVQASTGEPADRSEALRLKGPPVETYKIEAEIDASDQLEFPDQNPAAAEVGILPQLALLESLITPTAAELKAADDLLGQGAVEIAPMEMPLALFVWSAQRVAPVRVTELSIAEEAFDTALHPMRARVSMSLRVLSVMDLGFDHRGGKLFLAYLKNKEDLAKRAAPGSLGQLGLESAP